jgi:hypothetical protein
MERTCSCEAPATNGDPGAAHAHYPRGVRIAEGSVPEDCGGVLGWGWIDNRPFLRCLHGLTLTSCRLGHHDRAEILCRAMLWLNPGRQPGSGRPPE